ncbi:unnamed protein product, partial [Allacma fusca]
PDREVFRELLSQLPLNDIKGLDNLHLWMKKEINSNILRNYLGSIGGTDVGNVTRNILMKLISRQFALEINYKGRNGKIAFESCYLRDLIIECVRDSLKLRVKEVEVSKQLKNWFRGAKDRNGGRRRPTKTTMFIENKATDDPEAN